MSASALAISYVPCCEAIRELVAMIRRGRGKPVGTLVSLNSFILGFILGCVVFLLIGSSGVWTVCIGHGVGCVAGIGRNVFMQVPSPELYHSVELLPGRSPAAARTRKTSDADAVHSPVNQTGVTSMSSGPCPGRPLQLLVLVLSSPHGPTRRTAIRGTWLYNFRTADIKVMPKFLVGTKKLSRSTIGNLTQENAMFHDILFLPDLEDAYSNLSLKVLLGLKWAWQNTSFDFVLKADDDSYVQIDKLGELLQKLQCEDRLYWGFFMGYAFPEPTGRWAERRWFNCPHYLPYAMGGGYVLSRKVVEILMRFPDRLKMYNNEDVTVGSWLAPFRLTRKHDLRFDVESLSRGCNNHYVITHKEKVRSLYNKYSNLMKTGNLCSEEKEIRPAYIYNWTVPPLDCCNRTKGIPVPPLNVL